MCFPFDCVSGQGIGGLLEKRWFCGEVVSFCEGFDVRIYRRAVAVACAEVLGSLRVSNQLIAGSIVAEGDFVQVQLCQLLLKAP